jgi:hypothetical protein
MEKPQELGCPSNADIEYEKDEKTLERNSFVWQLRILLIGFEHVKKSTVAEVRMLTINDVVIFVTTFPLLMMAKNVNISYFYVTITAPRLWVS